ncbi:MAG: hypothetical protein KGJ23_02435 [Euryarchaeota archaeon]|nr:hypothetical protein [Euryarchaeota archaeon]MDE1879590.1 hypothetical protein [Euryarchaeota archaeon]MDE2046310.1 hypothetical protein [Thermoplasmata archaeon]
MGSYQYQEGGWDAEIRSAEVRGRRRTHPTRLLIVLALLAVLALVLAYFLYAMVLSPSKEPNPTYALGMTNKTGGHASGVYIVNLTVSAPAALTTGMTGLEILNRSAALSSGSVPGACDQAAATFFDCLGASATLAGWIVLLLSDSGVILATYPSTHGATTWSTASGVSVPFITAGTIAILSPMPLLGSGDVLSVFGTGGSKVSGSVVL